MERLVLGLLMVGILVGGVALSSTPAVLAGPKPCKPYCVLSAGSNLDDICCVPETVAALLKGWCCRTL